MRPRLSGARTSTPSPVKTRCVNLLSLDNTVIRVYQGPSGDNRLWVVVESRRANRRNNQLTQGGSDDAEDVWDHSGRTDRRTLLVDLGSGSTRRQADRNGGCRRGSRRQDQGSRRENL